MLASGETSGSPPLVALSDPLETSHALRWILTYITDISINITDAEEARRKLREERGTDHCEDVINAYQFAEKYDVPLLIKMTPGYLLALHDDFILDAMDLFMFASHLDLDSLASKSIRLRSFGGKLECPWGSLEVDQRSVRVENLNQAMFAQMRTKYLFALGKASRYSGAQYALKFDGYLMEWDKAQ